MMIRKNTDEQKKNLRKKYLKKRERIHHNTNAKINMIRRITHHGVSCVAHIHEKYIVGAKTVAVYYPIGSEVDVMPLAKTLAQQNITITLPVVLNQTEPLIFRQWNPLKPKQYQLQNGYLNIPQPKPSAPVIQPKILFVPLLAFNKQGCRLGYGGGFYDRTIQKHHPVTIGVAFDAQYEQNIPMEEYDQKLNYVITENEIINTQSKTV